MIIKFETSYIYELKACIISAAGYLKVFLVIFQRAIIYARYKGFPKGNTQMNVSKFIMLTYFLPQISLIIHLNLVINKKVVI